LQSVHPVGRIANPSYDGTLGRRLRPFGETPAGPAGFGGIETVSEITKKTTNRSKGVRASCLYSPEDPNALSPPTIIEKGDLPMRRFSVLAVLAGVPICVALFCFRPGAAQIGKQSGLEEQPHVKTVQLPIGQVVLFSSGVGYFQREGSVEGDVRVDLSFPVADVNDLLKSMVVRDLDGGHVSTVSYDSNAPVERSLKSFAINLTGNPGFGPILNQARGEKVEVVLQQGNATQPGTMAGTVVGIETQHQPAGKDGSVEVELINLWCSDGMRSFKLNEVQRLRFLNPILESEVRKALETLALSHNTQKKAVSISFQGRGKREVRVGYVIENPIWKTSYRLVLDKKEKPYLQGWAIVENPTDEDWKDVKMALIAGRPISFQMDLYTPLYIQRPVVDLELFASLRPVAYSGALDSPDRRMGASKRELELEASIAKKRYEAILNARRRVASAVSDDETRAAELEWQLALERLNQRMDLKTSVAPAATAAKLGDFFQYAVNKPVSLPRQKSAMLPIVGKDIEANRVSIYNERVQAKFPLLGLKFKNTSGLHLMQGPITVFEGSNYAGDSRVLDIQPDEERLLSYAIDLGTEVNSVPHSDNGKIVQLKAVKGIITTTTKVRDSKSYTIKNRNDVERLVLIEHPVRNEFKLVDTDKPAETASDFYRFQVKVAPSNSETLTVTEERVLNETVHLTNLNDDQIRILISQTAASEKVRIALKNVQELRQALDRTQQEINELDRQLGILTNDQSRLRSNLREVPSDSEIAKRYLKKLNEQETVIEKYQADVKKLETIGYKQRKEFEQFLANVSAE